MKDLSYIEKVLNQDPSTRINKLKASFVSCQSEMCCERAEIVTQVYQEHEDEPNIIKRAMAVAEVLRKMTIFIGPDELLVGYPSEKPRSASIFPEMSVHWVKELDLFETRKHNRLKVSERTREVLERVVPYWEKRSVNARIHAARCERVNSAVQCGQFSNPHEWSGLGHVALNWPKLLAKGLNGILAEISEAKQNLDLTDPDYEPKRAFYQAEEIIYKAGIDFGRRFSDLAWEMAQTETDPQRLKDLKKIAVICSKVPAEPAQTFHEALQSLWFCQLIPQIESNGFSITPGRSDQYLFPYLERDLEDDRITLFEAQELLDCFFLRCCEILRVDDKGAAEVNAGYASGQNLCAGGVNSQGEDATNILSYMCLVANQHIGLHQPNFTVRLHKKTPEIFLENVVNTISEGNGMPQILNDEIIIPSAMLYGFTLEQARDYIPVGCDEITIEGMWGRCNGCYFNMLKPLEYVLYNGVSQKHLVRSGMATGDPREFSSYQEFHEAYNKQLTYAIELVVNEGNLTDHVHGELFPLPFVSGLVSGCLEKGKDITKGGALYNFIGPVGIGAATVGDCLAAVKKFVFEDKIISMADLIAAMDRDFTEQEDLRQMLVNKVPKFGNDNDYVDSLVVDITNKFFDELEKYQNTRDGKFFPTLMSVTGQIWAGLNIGATPDGRKAWQPVSDGLSPMNGCDRLGPTAALKSITKVDLKRVLNGVICNQRLSPEIFKSETGLKKMGLLLRSFVDLGGFHWQFNVIDTKTLLEAQKYPEQHRGLIVRVAGYSAVFVELSKKAQDSIITRTEANL